MPMSEDVASAAVSMAGKTVAGTVDMSAKMLDALLRLLREMNEIAVKRAEKKDAKMQQKQQKSVVQKDLLNDLKMKGRVSLPDLRKHAAVTGNQIVYSDQGVSKADVAVISKNAKAMGIPIAFSRAADKQNYYPCVSSADAQAFKVMLQGIIANKLNLDRQKPENERQYRQVAVSKWELPFISQECQRLDIQGNFAPHPTERNQVIFIYRKIDEDAALSITNQIEQSCKELKDVKITPDSEGFVTIKDNQTGRTYSFDTANTSEEVMVNELQDQLGFDSLKAKLTAAKFESDCLTSDQIEDFKQNDPHNAFVAFGEMYIPDPETGKESPVTEPYKMGYYACKYGDQPAFSISNPQGKTILFTADKATYKEVQHRLSQDLDIKDKALLLALTDKVIQCSRSMAKENMSTEISFERSDFDMSDPQIASGMRRTTPDGKVFVKKQPLESLSMQISRTNKETFLVTSIATAIEFDETGNENTAYNTRELELSLYDNKKAYDGIKNALVSQGVPLETAKNIARDTITKAQSQPEKEIVYVEQMTTYPRTDSQYLTDDMEQTALDVANRVFAKFPQFGHAQTINVKRCINNKKVTGHHAIIPTAKITDADLSKLSEVQRNVLCLIASRLILATADPHRYEAVKAIVQCAGTDFTANGKTVKEMGWKALESNVIAVLKSKASDDEKEDTDCKALPELIQGQIFQNVTAKKDEHWTSPPKPYTEATLLSAMERAGNNEYDDETEKKGLGTPATRAGIIEELVKNEYIQRKGKQITATEKGVKLIAVVPDEVKSPKLTAEWEMQLQQIEHGKANAGSFMDGIKGYVKEICTKYGAVDESVSFKQQSEAIGKCPHCGGEVKKGQYGYYCTKKCGMYLAKVFGKTLTDNQLTRLLDGKEISYTVDGKKTIVMPEAVEHTYNGKTSWQWKTRRG